MERRATLLCKERYTDRKICIDLKEAALPLWRSSVGLLACVAVAAGISQLGSLVPAKDMLLAMVIFACSGLAHLLYWLQHVARNKAGCALIGPNQGFDTTSDPNALCAAVNQHNAIWQPRVRSLMLAVTFADLAVLMLTMAMMIGTQNALVIFYLLYWLPSNVMVMTDARRSELMTHVKPVLHWMPNVLGHPGLIRYDEEL